MHYLLPGYPQSKIPLHIRHDFQCHYPYLVVNSDREKSVEYAKPHMAKDQRGDDWQDQCEMVKIQFTAKGVALYLTDTKVSLEIRMHQLSASGRRC